MPAFEILEMVGLSLLLISVGWEVFFTQTFESMTTSLEWMHLHEKMDQLNYRQGQLQKELELRLHGLETNTPIQTDPLPTGWNPTPSEESLRYLQRQHRLLWFVKSGMFMLGALLLIAAKVIEYGYRQSAFIQT